MTTLEGRPPTDVRTGTVRRPAVHLLFPSVVPVISITRFNLITLVNLGCAKPHVWSPALKKITCHYTSQKSSIQTSRVQGQPLSHITFKDNLSYIRSCLKNKTISKSQHCWHKGVVSSPNDFKVTPLPDKHRQSVLELFHLSMKKLQGSISNKMAEIYREQEAQKCP